MTDRDKKNGRPGSQTTETAKATEQSPIDATSISENKAFEGSLLAFIMEMRNNLQHTIDFYATRTIPDAPGVYDAEREQLAIYAYECIEKIGGYSEYKNLLNQALRR